MQKRKKKTLKGHDDSIELVVEKDVNLDKVLDLDGKTSIWFFARCHVSFRVVCDCMWHMWMSLWDISLSSI
jgi:hypothetical protein